MVEPFKAASIADNRQWWTGLKPGDLPERVVLPLLIDMKPEVYAGLMDDFVHIGGATEYQAYRGRYKGLDVGVVYAGSGAYSTSTCIDELAHLGVKVLIRIANSGGMAEDVAVGDYVVTTGSIRAERVLLDYVPAEYPGIADRHIVDAMVSACAEAGVPAHEGLTLTVASFYPGSGFPTPLGVLDDEVLRRVHLWLKAGAKNMDGETSTLMVLGPLYGIRTGALLAVGNHVVTGKGDYLDDLPKLVRVGLDSLVIDAKRQAAAS